MYTEASQQNARARVKSIDLNMVNSSNVPLYIKADATILSQVLLNLISNAVKVRTFLLVGCQMLTICSLPPKMAKSW